MPARRITEGAVQMDRYDERTWDRLVHESPRVQGAVDKETISGLCRDLWASLYKSAPMIREAGPSVNRKLMSIMMQQSSWNDLRQTTQLDEYSAALGFLHLEVELLASIPEDVLSQAKELQALETQVQQWLDEGEALTDAAQGIPDEPLAAHTTVKAQMLTENARKLTETLEEATHAFQQTLEENLGSLGRTVRHALDKTIEYSEELERTVQTFGMGKGNPVSGKDRLELAEILVDNPKVREIAQLAGRMQMISIAKRRQRSIQPPSEVVNISVGRDLAQVLPSELSLLGDAETEDDFIRRFVEGRLLQYDLCGLDREGQGPIVACIDESASTQGEVEKWEKGLTLALFAIAKRENRAFAVIHFGNRQEIRVDKWMRPKDATPMQLVDMVQHFFNGGTDFEQPLREAVKVMEDASFTRGDIVFITDGEATVSDAFLSEEFLRVKSEKGFHVISVVIGHEDEAVRPFSDIVATPQMADDSILTFVIESLN